MISSLDLLAVPLLIQPRRLLAVLPARVQGWPVLSCPPGPFLQSCSFACLSPCWAAAGLLPSLGQHLAFLLAEVPKVLFSLFLQPTWVSLKGSSALQHVAWSLTGVICRLDECALHCLLQGTDKNMKQDRSQARPLLYSISYLPGSWTPVLCGRYSHSCHPQPALPCQWTAGTGELWPLSACVKKFSLTPSEILTVCVLPWCPFSKCQGILKTV